MSVKPGLCPLNLVYVIDKPGLTDISWVSRISVHLACHRAQPPNYGSLKLKFLVPLSIYRYLFVEKML